MAPQEHEAAAEAEGPEHFTVHGTFRGGVEFVPTTALRTHSSLKDGKSTTGCNYSDDHNVTCISDMFQPPVVRQWLRDGRLYREATERLPSRFELFYDLVLVGVVHQLADVAAEGGPTGASILKVVLTFYPAWSVWSDYRNWLNMSGVDDVSQRIQTLVLILLLVGYSANASAIELGGEAATATSEVAHRLLFARATEVVAEVGEATAHHGGPQHTVIAATAFFLVAKLIRIITLAFYSWTLPEFRVPLLMRASGIAVVSLIYMGCCFAENIRNTAILAGVGMGVEILLRFSIGIAVSIDRRRGLQETRARESAGVERNIEFEELMKHRLIPAINLEHMVERTAAFVTVVLGESVVSLLYVAHQGATGLSHEFARAVFGLTVAFVFNALYFDSALSRTFVHAIRRHWATHVIWDTLHFPLCAGLILASAALNKLVTTEEVAQSIRWQYGGGLCVALTCITTIGLIHQSLDNKTTSGWRFGQWARGIIRFVVAIVFALVPLKKEINDLNFLAIYVCVVSALVIFELWSKLGVEEHVEEDHHPVEDGEPEDQVEDSASSRVDPLNPIASAAPSDVK